MVTSSLGKDIPIVFQKLMSKNSGLLKNFNSGNRLIDEHFRDKALYDNSTVTYLFIDSKNDVVVACASICCSKVDIYNFDNAYHDSLPAYEIKYFATNKEYHGLKYENGNETTLSKVIMQRLIYFLYSDCRKMIGAEKIILYSLKRAVHFYESCEFKKFEPYMLRSNDDFVSGCIPMYFDLDPEV